MAGYSPRSRPPALPVLDLLPFRLLLWAGWARRSSHKTRITNSRAVLQGVVNPAARVNLGPTFSTAVLGWLDHQQSPCSITSRIKHSASRVRSHSRRRRPRKAVRVTGKRVGAVRAGLRTAQMVSRPMSTTWHGTWVQRGQDKDAAGAEGKESCLHRAEASEPAGRTTGECRLPGTAR